MKKANFLSISLVLALSAAFGGCASTPPAPISDAEYRENYCHYDGAYKLGMNDAIAGNPMAAMVAKPCTAETKVAVERGYREGYTKAMETKNGGTATTVHVTEPPALPAVAGPDKGKFCLSAKDCRGGQFCKARADKIMVCMGDGRHGEYCEAHVDCANGGFCRTAGDGIKRCMKSGAKDTICASSTDCEENLLCKAGAGKNKVCR